MPVVIRVENVAKHYRLGALGARTLREDLSRRWAAMRGRPDPSMKVAIPDHGNRKDLNLLALQDVSFEVRQGDILGIIGRNGAGKSTLLKILSRITGPTMGLVKIRGRVGSLLEVGTGFHPELTGRENIFLNGAILGMRKAEIARRLDEIVTFAEIERFIDTPVKRYSSGMYVRLGFAVAAHLEPEILVVDEVLAVGDIEFQKKCLGKMSNVARGGRTVLFVSHNMAAVKALCSRAIVLSQGVLSFDGATNDAITNYSDGMNYSTNTRWTRSSKPAGASVFFEEVVLSLSGAQPDLILNCVMTIRCSCPSAKSFVAIDICDQVFSPIMQAMPEHTPFIDGAVGQHIISVQVHLPPLIPGQYGVQVWVGSHHSRTLDEVQNALAFEVHETPSLNRVFPHHSTHGNIVAKCEYAYQKVVATDAALGSP